MLLSLPVAGCSQDQIEPASKETPTVPVSEKNILTPPSWPITVDLLFPNGAPPLNQQAELNCIIKAQSISIKNMTVEIRLPEAFELVSGNLSWSGDINTGDELVAIRAGIRAVQIGNWAIEIRQSMNPEKQSAYSFYPDWRDGIYASIFEESARWGIYPLWYEGGGFEAPVFMAGDPLTHINMNMSISHLPILDESAELICTIMPHIDYPDVKAEIVLPEEANLVAGGLAWQGDLKKDTPVHYLVKIKFTETGNWRIDAGLWRWFDGEYSWRVKDSLYLKIGVSDSEYSPPQLDTSDLPPPPTITEPS